MTSELACWILAGGVMAVLYLLMRYVSDDAASTRSFVNIGFPMTVAVCAIFIVLLGRCAG